MTNEEAIQFLDNIKGEEAGRSIGKEGFYAELLGYHIEALDKAIEVLKNNKEVITLKCPYNDFKDCLDFQCPFYYRQWQTVDHATGKRGDVSHCKRVEKELYNNN